MWTSTEFLNVLRTVRTRRDSLGPETASKSPPRLTGIEIRPSCLGSSNTHSVAPRSGGFLISGTSTGNVAAAVGDERDVLTAVDDVRNRRRARHIVQSRARVHDVRRRGQYGLRREAAAWPACRARQEHRLEPIDIRRQRRVAGDQLILRHQIREQIDMLLGAERSGRRRRHRLDLREQHVGRLPNHADRNSRPIVTQATRTPWCRWRTRAYGSTR